MATLKLSNDRNGTFGHHHNGNTTITFRRRLNHNIDRVWRAITEPAETNAWFPMLKTLNLKQGGQVVMDFSGGDCPANELNPDDVDHCTVTELSPPNVLEYLGPTGGLRFELRPLGDQCELTLSAINHPDQGILYIVVCGWHYYTECLEWHLDAEDFGVDADMPGVEEKIVAHYRNNNIPGFDG